MKYKTKTNNLKIWQNYMAKIHYDMVSLDKTYAYAKFSARNSYRLNSFKLGIYWVNRILRGNYSDIHNFGLPLSTRTSACIMGVRTFKFLGLWCLFGFGERLRLRP